MTLLLYLFTVLHARGQTNRDFKHDAIDSSDYPYHYTVTLSTFSLLAPPIITPLSLKILSLSLSSI
jgi:hypothetical protein